MEHRLYSDNAFDFVARTSLGHAGQGVIDVGVVWEVLQQIPDGDPVAWHNTWSSAGVRLRAQAGRSQELEHLATAGWQYLGASECFDNSLAFVDGIPTEAEFRGTFRAQQECWRKFLECSDGRHLAFPVPYEDTALPGFLLRPDGSGRSRPTIVVTNGSDGSLTSLWATIIRAGLERDWNVFVFDGPGQQTMLFERDTAFRFDWEAVLRPVVDCLVERNDVDADNLLAYGISQGGYWLPRALAFEQRFVAAAVDGGVMDVARTWNAHLPSDLLRMLRSGDFAAFNLAISRVPTTPRAAAESAFRAKPYGAATPFELFSKVQEFNLRDTVSLIQTPLLVVDPDHEQFWPGQSQELFAALTGPKRLLHVTQQDGGASHCEPLARGLVAHRVNDFYSEYVSRGRK